MDILKIISRFVLGMGCADRRLAEYMHRQTMGVVGEGVTMNGYCITLCYCYIEIAPVDNLCRVCCFLEKFLLPTV